jgi:hypothetical protein
MISAKEPNNFVPVTERRDVMKLNSNSAFNLLGVTFMVILIGRAK